MVFVNPQTARNWKLLTYFATAGTGFYSVFYATYNPNDPRDHCFSYIQRVYHAKVNELLGRSATPSGGLPLPPGGPGSAPPGASR